MNSPKNSYSSHFGILWFVLSLTGIDVFKDSKVKNGPLIAIRKWCFPTLLFANFCFLLSLPFMSEKIGYISFMDSFLPFFPIFLWVLILKRRKALKELMIHLNSITFEDLELPRCFTWVINVSIVLSFVTVPALILMSLLCREEEHISKEVQFRYLHEILFHSTVTILYCGICYVFIKLLQTLKSKFDTIDQSSDLQSAQNLVNSYMSVVKGLDIFRDLLSTPVFLILCQDIAIVTVYVLDFLETDMSAVESMMPEIITYTIYTSILILILTVMVAAISLRMHRIKSTILNKMSSEAQSDDEACNGKHLSSVLKGDASVISACGVFPLNRAFLLQAIATLIAQTVVFYQMASVRNLNAE